MSNEKHQQEPGDIVSHGFENPPEGKNFVCSDCGEEFAIEELYLGEHHDPLHIVMLCKGCKPCSVCGSPIVDGKCEDIGDHGCRGEYPDCENPFMEDWKNE